MKTRFLPFGFLVLTLLAFCATRPAIGQPAASKPPVTETYTAQSRVRSGIALGGLGTGSVELRKDGQFYNWTIFNNQPLSTGTPFTLSGYPNDAREEALQFFLVRYQEEGGPVRIRLLQLNNSLTEGGMQSIDYYYPWMRAVEQVEYSGRFPFINMKFTDPEMPFEVHLEAFSPFIPHDAKHSALPGAYFNFRIVSKSSRKVNVMLVATQRNCTGYDTTEKYFVSTVEEKNGPDGYKHFSQTAGGMDEKHASFGQMGMASLSDRSTYYLGWEHKHPYYELLLVNNTFPNLNDTEGRNKTNAETGVKKAHHSSREQDQRAFSSVAITEDLAPGAAFSHTFLMTWFFPNNYGSHNRPAGEPGSTLAQKGYDFGQKLTKDHGHYYENFFASAAEVADYMAANREMLTNRSRQFVEDFYASDAPHFVLDQINSQLNTFVTSSTFTQSGNFGIREGMTPEKSWGPNNTIDVALYGSTAIVGLFPELQKSTMRAHKRLQTAEGEINHGLGYDLDFTQNGTWGVYHRIDMPGNYIQQVLRDFFHTNDRAYLQEMWPSLKQAVEYVLSKRDEDKDQMPDMTGIMCSYDNFPMYGMASYIQSQWLAAMRGMTIAAGVLNDKAAAARYQAIYQKGSALMDQHLWNGEYYILSKDYTGLCKEIPNAPRQDNACLTDQIIGQWMAHQSGLGYLFKEEHVKKSLQSVLRMSFRPDFGLRNCTWPEHPELYPIHQTDLWVDQANTPWTGVELAFASFLLYEGMYEDALAVIGSVDERYRRAGLYWDHQEFGGHYYRPMSAWQIVNALLGLSINQEVYAFSPKLPKEEFTLFFSTHSGTAHYQRTKAGVAIKVLTGTFAPRQLALQNSGIVAAKPQAYLNGQPVKAKLIRQADTWQVAMPAGVSFKAGDVIEVR